MDLVTNYDITKNTYYTVCWPQKKTNEKVKFRGFNPATVYACGYSKNIFFKTTQSERVLNAGEINRKYNSDLK